MRRAPRPVSSLLVRASLVLALSAAALVSTASTAPDAPAASAPSDLSSLAGALGRLTERLDALTKRANRDRRWDEVEEYARYGASDFADRKRNVKAERLVAIWGDPSADPALRRKAFDVMCGDRPMQLDPDLTTERRGTVKPRNRFAMEHLTDLLVEGDSTSRTLANEFLRKYFLKPQNEPAIDRYDPTTSSDKDRQEARRAWNKHLRR